MAKKTTTKSAPAKTTKRKKPATAKKKKSTKRKPVSKAGMFTSPLNLGLAVLGALVAVTYKDDARLVKMVPNQKGRYALMTGIGFAPALAGKIPALRSVTSKIPEGAQAFMIGAGVGAGLSLAPLIVPKLLPAPKKTAMIDSGGGNKTTRATVTRGDGTVEELTAYIEKMDPAAKTRRESLRGINSTLTGRMPRRVLTGRRGAMLTGAGDYQWNSQWG